MNKTDFEDLQEAFNLLENPGLTARITNLIGMPLEKAYKYLPENWSDKVNLATREAMTKSLSFVVASMDTSAKNKVPANLFHKILTGFSGAAGGAFGLPALIVELPASTTIMIRSIADVARSQGENLSNPESQLACMEVFALGGYSESDDFAETGYFGVRVALAKALSEAAEYITARGLLSESAPAVLRFVSVIASRFGIIVSNKVAAQAVPIIGAASGALINVLFTDHFQNMAKGHFIIRRLEKKYRPDFVRQRYDALKIDV